MSTQKNANIKPSTPIIHGEGGTSQDTAVGILRSNVSAPDTDEKVLCEKRLRLVGLKTSGSDPFEETNKNEENDIANKNLSPDGQRKIMEVLMHEIPDFHSFSPGEKVEAVFGLFGPVFDPDNKVPGNITRIQEWTRGIIGPALEPGAFKDTAGVAEMLAEPVPELKEHHQDTQEALKNKDVDEFTGLKYGKGFEKDLKKIIESEEGVSAYSFAAFDLDGLKDLNDSFGMPVGDHAVAILVDTCKAVSQILGVEAKLYRPNGSTGDELFAVLPIDKGEEYGNVVRMMYGDLDTLARNERISSTIALPPNLSIDPVKAEATIPSENDAPNIAGAVQYVGRNTKGTNVTAFASVSHASGLLADLISSNNDLSTVKQVYADRVKPAKDENKSRFPQIAPKLRTTS
jgi:GGDEF domain-containing protein